MLDSNAARHCLGFRVFAFASAIYLPSKPLCNITLIDSNPAVSRAGSSSRRLAADVDPELLLCFLLALSLMSWPATASSIVGDTVGRLSMLFD